ncbi:MAG: DUF4956 domain-containing protein [Desulfobulbaceae bacterium]|nr:DUF4956 domain-containing protein [Desulfobulbaceae bacterium]
MPSILGFDLYSPQNYFDFLVRLTINLVAIFILGRKIYFKYRPNRDYFFTLLTFNIIVFFVCYLLNKVVLSLGFAFGIFAIFSILRYRTLTIPIKEMTYIFIAISVAIINALSANIIGLIEILAINAALVLIVYLLEPGRINNELFKIIRYEKIELIKPENHTALLEDLSNRTGLQIHKVDIGRIDFLRDTALIRAYYFPSNGEISNDFE